MNVEGEQKKLLVVEVQSKGEKTTGEKEFVYVGTERLKEALQKRRFALKHDPDAYVFGTEDGRHQKDFRRMWRELFKLAGLKWGARQGSGVAHAAPRVLLTHRREHRRSGRRAGAGASQGSAYDSGIPASASLARSRGGRPLEPEVIWIA